MPYRPKITARVGLIFSFIIISFGLLALPPSSVSGADKEPKVEAHTPTITARPTDIGEAFTGEESIYDMGFWIFKNIAKGVFTLKEESDGTYTAKLDASSKARLFRSTRSTFTAHLKKSADNKRFITLNFEKYSKRGKKVKRIVKEIDHEKRIVTITKWKNGVFRSTEEIEIPEGVTYDDPLGAFYNLRFGAYGPLKDGEKFLITTFPAKGKEIKIQARIASKKELKKGLRKRRNNAKLLIKAKLDKELFESSSGDIELYFDENMATIDVVAKDILLFGDVYARFNRKKSLSPGAKPFAPLPPSPPSSKKFDDFDADLF
jgi:hypothetical protein